MTRSQTVALLIVSALLIVIAGGLFYLVLDMTRPDQIEGRPQYSLPRK